METLRGSIAAGTGKMPVILFALVFTSSALAAGRVVNLDADSPYYPNRNYAKLITPQWVGEEGVEAVIILAIDDMRDQPRYEKFLRPILNRLKKIDGRAPLSIMTCKIDPATPALQGWLKEGLSLEVHTVEHPCPVLAGGDFDRAKSTFDRCLDQIAVIPNNVPVAFRTPCCDSLNTPSPRLYAEIFNKKSPGGNFLRIDSSVMNVISASDPELPRELVLEKDGRERFRKYLPFDSFVNTIDDYPYPYVIGGLCWEFPCATPSDWEAQFVHKQNASPITLADWKAELDATVIKKGVMTTVFHPYGWSAPEQWVELIDYAQAKYGKKVKFLNFREAADRLAKNVGELRGKDGSDNGVRLMDLNGDGFLDVVAMGSHSARIWDAATGAWKDGAYPENLKKAETLVGNGRGYLRDLNHDGRAELIVGDKVFGWDGGDWRALPFSLPAGISVDSGAFFVDVNEDGFDDLLISNSERSGLLLFESMKTGWTRVVHYDKRTGGKNDLPMIVRADGTNNGLWVHSRTLWWQNEDTAKLPNLVDRRTFNELLAGVEPLAKSPAASLASIRVAPGYKVELVASEPLVQDPIAFAFGPDGKLWVAEMPDYPLGVDGKGKIGGRVKYLEDLNGDGVYDKATLFLDDLRYPTSVLPWKKGVLIAAAPDIFYAEDTDGDGKADKREVLFSGFREGNQQHRVNHLSFGLDNWIYGANGESGGNVKSMKTGKTVSISGRDFRFRPDTGEFESVAGGGQFARSRTDGGDWFGNNNSNPLWHYPLEEEYLKRNPFVPPGPGVLRVSVPEVAGATPVFAISPFQARYNDLHTANHFTSACAAHVYRDDLFPAPVPAAVTETATGEWSIVLIGRDPAKVIKASTHMFAAGDRISFAFEEPAGPGADTVKTVRVAPNGTIRLPLMDALSVAGKTGEEIVTGILKAYGAMPINMGPVLFTLKLNPPLAASEYPLQVFISEPVHNLVHRELVSADGSTFWGRRASTEQASEFLASSDNWFRPTTVETGPDGALYIADMYRQTIEHPEWIPKDAQAKLDLRLGHDMGRIYRVSPVGAKRRAIPRLDKLDTAGLVAALDSSNGWQRDMAQAMLIWHGDKTAVALLEKVDGKNLLALVHAIYTLDGMGALKPEAISRALAEPSEPGTFSELAHRHAIRLAGGKIGELADERKLLSLALAADEPQTRLQLAYALGSWDDPKAASILARMLTDPDADQYLIAAATSSLNAKNIAGVAAALTEDAKRHPLAPAELANVLRTAVGTNQTKAIAAMLATLTQAKGGKYEAWQYRALANLLDSLEEARTPLAKFFRGDVADDSAKQVQAVIAAARTFLNDDAGKLEDRAAAVALLGRDAATRTDDLAVLDRLLLPQSPTQMQAAVIAALSKRREAEGTQLLLNHWKGLTPPLRSAAVDGLLSRAESAKLLLDAVAAKKVLVMEIDAPRRQRMLQYPDKIVRARAGELFAQTINADRQKVIDGFAAALTLAGDAKRGKEIFGKTCATCHRLADVGNAVGPDLMSVGDKSSQGLLIAILDPNRAVEPRYINYIAITNDDQTLTGLLASESAISITLLGPEGKPVTLRRGDLKDLRSSNTSLMPDGLEAGMTGQDLADLMAFVRAGK